MMNDKLMGLLKAELREGEEIKWTGSPDPKRMFIKNIDKLLFAAPWTVFTVFWFLVAGGFLFPLPREGKLEFISSAFPYFGVPFILLGLWLIAVPFWEYRKAKNTLYAITGKRALALVSRDGKTVTSVHSYYAAHINGILRVYHRDGRSSLFFSEDVKRSRRGGTYREKAGFLGIEDGAAAENLLRALAEK